MNSSLLPAWRPLLNGSVIRGYLVVAPNASVARLLIEQRMRQEGRFSLLREWQASRCYIEPLYEPGTVIPGAIP